MPGGGPDDHDPAVADTPSSDRGSVAHARSGAGADPGDTVAATTARKGPRQIRTGDSLGRYELGDELGEGGMATVFRARDRDLRRDVAVKVLFPHLARRPEIVRRFHREARAAAGLEHPNILRIYDVGGAEGEDPPYIVMELIRGRTLLQEIEQRGAMLAEIAACIGALLGDALAAAHAAGIIHRDVKPANVLIAPGWRLLLADFGVARLETEDSLVTRTGALLGTPAYMSPEQASGDIATARSDLYSLGVTLYQLATGALPYAGPPAKVMSMIASGNLVAPVRRRSSCGPDLSRSIERLMAIEPGTRPESATAVAAELRALASAGGLGDPTEELSAYFEDPEGFLRARTPVVVSTLIAAANAAIAEAKLPRAMALADRASAIAPEDPAVVALIRAVTEGGHASRRKRAFALSGAALAVAGGVTMLGWQVIRAPAAERTAEAGGTMPVDEVADAALAPASDAAGPPGGVSGAAPGEASLDARPEDMPDARPGPPISGQDPARAPASKRDATVTAAVARTDGRTSAAPDRQPLPSARDAASRHAPAAAMTPLDAAPAIDAAAPPEPAPELLRPDAAAEPAEIGYLVVHNDLWCDISIDGMVHGNLRNKPIPVTAGRHVVRCVNPAGEWTQEAVIAPGTTRTLTGAVARELEVKLGVDAKIDGKFYPRGATVKLKPGNVEVVSGNKRLFLTFRTSCTLRDTPELWCYP